MALFAIGCNDSVTVHENETMASTKCLPQDDNGYLLTKEEAKQALLKMIEKGEEESQEIFKRVDEATLALEKWMEESDEPIPDSLWRDYHDSCDLSLYNFEDEDKKYVSEDDRNMDYRKLFKEYTLIEIVREDMVYTWQCDLKEGWFRLGFHSTYFSIIQTGRFVMNQNNEWIAVVVSSENGDRLPFY